MSTPFDYESVDYLDKFMPVFKISSSDITNIPFIKHIASKQKPIFMSTGASTINEIKDAVNTIEKTGNDKLVILHCILTYPTRYEEANLNYIKYLQKKRVASETFAGRVRAMPPFEGPRPYRI